MSRSRFLRKVRQQDFYKPMLRALAPPVPDDLARDPRPARAGWQRGNQVHRCPKCDGRFRGGPQAKECANCAYGGADG